jgi:hypothetical protein
MSKNAFHRASPGRMALEEMESYCATHPNSPSAERRPALSIRRGLWIALLGPSVEQGIVGIGFTVEGALRAFDVQYMAGRREVSPRQETHSAKTRITASADRLSCIA